MIPTAMKLTTKVQPGHRVEFIAPELPEGADIEVSVALSDAPDRDALRQRFETLAARWHEETAAELMSDRQRVSKTIAKH